MAATRDRQIGALSGGQRRRVFLARALAAEPELYLLDEPVTGVDATTQEELMDVLEAEARAGKTVIATTHDLICAAQRFHQAAFINGRVVATDPPSWSSISQLLSDTYGGHVLVLPGDGGRLGPRRRPPPRRGAPAASATSTTAPLMDPIGFFADPLTYGFMQRGLAAAVIVGVVCAVMGTFVVLKGLAFIGDAVSHAAFPGLVIAYHLGAPLYLGGAIAAVGDRARHRLRLAARAGCASTPRSASSSPARSPSAILLFSTIKNYVADLLGYLLGNVLGIGGRRPHPGRDPGRRRARRSSS